LFDARGYRATLVMDDGAVSERYGATTIPFTVVIDGAGLVRAVGRGETLDLEAVIARLR